MKRPEFVHLSLPLHPTSQQGKGQVKVTNIYWNFITKTSEGQKKAHAILNIIIFYSW
jgi:hypothetical protein